MTASACGPSANDRGAGNFMFSHPVGSGGRKLRPIDNVDLAFDLDLFPDSVRG